MWRLNLFHAILTSVKTLTPLPIALTGGPVYSAGCIVHASTRGYAASLTAFIVHHNPMNMWACKPMCERECVQMPFQQGTGPHRRWHFYWRNVTTAIFFPYVCVSMCAIVSVYEWLCVWLGLGKLQLILQERLVILPCFCSILLLLLITHFYPKQQKPDKKRRFKK